MTSEWITGLPQSDITQRLRSDTGEALAGEKVLALLHNQGQKHGKASCHGARGPPRRLHAHCILTRILWTNKQLRNLAFANPTTNYPYALL
jgi:hypothetical protein